MNRLISRPWLIPAVGTVCYLAGFNDELLHVLGDWWLDLGRWVQTIVVLVLVGLVAYFVVDRARQRQSFYDAAVRAAAPPPGGASSVDEPAEPGTSITREIQ
ncbi:MAG: hypothetical protein ACR2PK_13585 [Acidimicrobiales bacterium]